MKILFVIYAYTIATSKNTHMWQWSHKNVLIKNKHIWHIPLHFIIRELAEEFKGQMEYSVGNAEKYITFLDTITKENENSKIVTYKIKFIDNMRFMARSLLSLTDNLAKGIYKDKWKIASLVFNMWCVEWFKMGRMQEKISEKVWWKFNEKTWEHMQILWWRH